MPKSGPTYLITPKWRKAVIRRLGEKGWNRAELARRLGCSRTAVTDLLTDGDRSTLVPDVEALLGLQTSLISTAAWSGEENDGKWQVSAGETIPRPEGWDIPPPAAEIEFPRKTPVPRRTDYVAHPLELTLDDGVRLMQMFADLNTTNRIKAVERIEALLAEQGDVDRMIADRGKVNPWKKEPIDLLRIYLERINEGDRSRRPRRGHEGVHAADYFSRHAARARGTCIRSTRKGSRTGASRKGLSAAQGRA